MEEGSGEAARVQAAATLPQERVAGVGEEAASSAAVAAASASAAAGAL